MSAPTNKESRRDAVKVGVGPSSVSVEIEGRAAPRALDALLDLISPFTNAAGWVGDQLSYARRNAAIRAASLACEQLEKEGISTAQIPPKILLPWLEGASLETDQADSLTEAWAGLFVRAVKSSDATVISYIETLKKIGKREAEMLQFFATDFSPTFSVRFYHPELDGIFSDNNPLLPKLVERLDAVLRSHDSAQIHKFFELVGIQGMCQVIFYSSEVIGTRSTSYFEENEHTISNMEHLGLISIRSRELLTSQGVVKIVWFEITKYGFDLIWACLGTLTGMRKASDPQSPKAKQ